jgi:hypothetical protein
MYVSHTRYSNYIIIDDGFNGGTARARTIPSTQAHDKQAHDLTINTHTNTHTYSSCSHDNTVKFWNIAYLYADDDEDEDDDDEEEAAEEGQGAGAGGDAGMGGSGSDLDSDDSDAPPRSKKSKKAKGKAKRPVGGVEGFYADM